MIIWFSNFLLQDHVLPAGCLCCCCILYYLKQGRWLNGAPCRENNSPALYCTTKPRATEQCESKHQSAPDPGTASAKLAYHSPSHQHQYCAGFLPHMLLLCRDWSSEHFCTAQRVPAPAAAACVIARLLSSVILLRELPLLLLLLLQHHHRREQIRLCTPGRMHVTAQCRQVVGSR